MPTFVKIKLVANYKKVNFYSICFYDDKESLFENFLKTHTEQNTKKLNHILAWIREIGNRYGAQSDFFRNEAEFSDTSALPPKNIHKEPQYIEKGKIETNMMRLYTFRLNNHVVFLYNGAVKTTKKSQDCPNVSPHFKDANRITKAIDECILTNGILWNEDKTDIEFDKNLRIQLS